MKYLYYYAFLTVVALLFFSPPAHAGQCGTITKAAGEPQIVRNGQTLAASVGTPVLEGDIIRAPKGASADFSINGVAGLSAAEGTECEIAKATEDAMKIDLELGELRANIKKLPANSSFSVETPTAIAAVRGTQFTSIVRMNAQNRPDSSFVVRDNVVDVTVKGSRNKIALDQGKALDVPSTLPPGGTQPREATGVELVNMEGASLITACA